MRSDKASLMRHKSFEKMSPEKQEKKANAVQNGVALMDENDLLPASRPCRDCLWIFLFLLNVIVMGFFAFTGFTSIQDAYNHPESQANLQIPKLSASSVATGVGASLVVGVGAAMGLLQLAKKAPKCLLYTSLIVPAVIMMLIGAAMCVYGMVLYGLVFVGLAVLQLTCVFVCFKKYIPFTIELMTIVAEVTCEHGSMALVSIAGSILSMIWSAIVTVGILGFYASGIVEDSQVDANEKYVTYAVVFLFTLCSAWGALVCNGICHTTFCGVFVRWYFDGARPGSGMNDPLISEGGTVGPSLKVAIGSSLGSICFGSFVVATIRALAQVAEQMQRDGAREGNAVEMIVGCILKCILDCIGDIVEYLNDWAYVQLALRGTDYCSSAKITFGMCTTAACKYILADSLIGSVVNFGCLLIGLLSGLAGYVGAHLVAPGPSGYVSAVFGVILGSMIGAATLGIFMSGTKAIIVCWAEKPEILDAKKPEMRQALEGCRSRLGF